MEFSVLIPVYNTEEYLDECLQSVLSQSYRDYEVIIVNDGSTDKSGLLCDEYERKYPNQITVIHQENQGLISARRVAISHAKGEFCVFVDSDDSVEINLLEKLYQCLFKDSDIDVILYSYYYYTKGKKQEHSRIAVDGTIWTKNNKTELYEKLVFSSSIDAIWIKAIKTDLLLKDPIPYDKYKKQNMSEDLLQSLYPITFADKIYYLDVPLYNYRYNENSISRCFTKDSISAKNSLYVYYEIQKILPLWDVDQSDFIKHINARWFNETMYIFFHSFEKANSNVERNVVLYYDWDSFLPKISKCFDDKSLVREYVMIYNCWKKKQYRKIKLHFMKRRILQSYKRMRNRK